MPKNKVAVEPLFDPDVSPGGIIIPDQAKERCDQGLVKYVGEGCEFDVGQHVLFSGYAGTLLKLQGEGLLIILDKRFVIATIEHYEATEVEGLYFLDREGHYFKATVEQASFLMADAIRRKRLIQSSAKKKIMHKPKPEEYDEREDD